MILQALGRTRARTTSTEQQDDLLSESGVSPQQYSPNPFETSTSFVGNVIGDVSPTRAPKVTKRERKQYSNNLSKSGKLRDDVHSRVVRRGSGGSALPNSGSDASTISRTLWTNSNLLHPGPPEADSPGISAPSSPNVFTDRESLSTFQSAFFDSSPNTPTETRPSHTFQPDALKRASLALEEVLREIEFEETRVDDDIVLLRSHAAEQRQRVVSDVIYLEQEDEVFTVTALSHDDHVVDQPSVQPSKLMYEAPKKMSPTHKIPGYIPGMQRPMTPHEIFEPREQSSATPQAVTLRHSTSSLGDLLHNPNFDLNPITTTKPDVKRTITRNVGSPTFPESPHTGSGRSHTQGYSLGDNERAGDYERVPNVISEMDPGSLLPFPRMSRSPTPDSNVPPTTATARTMNHQESAGKRAKPPGFSIDQPNIINTSTTKMGKHQKHESGSSFVLSFEHSTRPLVLTSFSNQSHSSLRSEGSNYHSGGEEDGKKDCVRTLFAKIEGQPPKWYDFTDIDIDTSCLASTPGEVSFRSLVKEEELVKQLSGLRKSDFVAVQERLLGVVQSRTNRVDRENHPTQLPPRSRRFAGQLSAPNLTIPGDDELAKQVLAETEVTMDLRKFLFGFPLPPALKRRTDRDQISRTLGLGQRPKEPSGTLKAEPSLIREDSSRDSSRHSVIASLSGPPLQLLSRSQVSPALANPPRLARSEHDKTRASFLVLLFSILGYPPFNEVIRWDGTKRVVLDQPQILESYILMPVFGLTALDVFKRRLYVYGFDTVPRCTLGHDVHPETAAWEHPRLTRLNPPMGFINCDWPEEVEFNKAGTEQLFTLDEATSEEESCLPGPIPIPVSADDGKTLDWSRPVESESPAQASIYSGPTVYHEKKLAAIRLRVKPNTREMASKVAEGLQRRYDLLFLHLETPNPLLLTPIVRWGISNSKIPAHAWKSPVPTQVIEDYLTNKPDDRPASPIPERNWVQVVDKFISKCDHLYKTTDPEPWPSGFTRVDYPRARSRASSGTGSLSEGHISPEDDGPSKKVVHHD